MKSKPLLFSNDTLLSLYSSTILKLQNKGSINVVTYPGSSKKTKLKILFEYDSEVSKRKRLYFHFDAENFNKDENRALQDSILFMQAKANTEWIDTDLKTILERSFFSRSLFMQDIVNLSNKGYRIVFFIENHEQLILENNLKLLTLIDSLFQIPQLNISLLWLTAKDLFNYDIELTEKITRLINREIVLEKDYPYTEDDLNNSIKYYEKELEINLEIKTKSLIKKFSIKDANLVKHLMLKIKNKNIRTETFSEEDVSTIYNLIGQDYLDKKYKRYIKMLSFIELLNLKNNKYSECLFMNMLGIIENNEIVQPLFKYFVENKLNTVISSLNKLTGTEILVFNRLKSNINKVISRDEIADVLWGEKWVTKYSDYMIDKVISNIRKKVTDQYQIEVVKGTGFILNSK